MPTSVEAKTSALLASLWRKNLPTLRERVEVLERAAAALKAGALPESLRAEAGATAHKLAGSLGMFGYPEGTEIGREMEAMLLRPQEPDARRFAELTRRLRAEVLPEA